MADIRTARALDASETAFDLEAAVGFPLTTTRGMLFPEFSQGLLYLFNWIYHDTQAGRDRWFLAGKFTSDESFVRRWLASRPGDVFVQRRPRTVATVLLQDGRRLDDLPETLKAALLEEAGGEAPPDTPPRAMTEGDLATELRRTRKVIQARLVEFMAGRRTSHYSDVGREVHDDNEVPVNTVRSNCNRTNQAARELNCPYVYRLAGQYVHKEDLGGG